MQIYFIINVLQLLDLCMPICILKVFLNECVFDADLCFSLLLVNNQYIVASYYLIKTIVGTESLPRPKGLAAHT